MQRHATDIVSLVFGATFAGFALIWLLTVSDVMDVGDVWLIGPVILIFAGIVGLFAALRSHDDTVPPTGAPD